jgi:hypothetical protein
VVYKGFFALVQRKLWGQSDRGNKETASTPTPTPDSAIIRQEQVVTAYIKAYLTGRDKWIRIILIIYGILLVIIIAWFTIISSYLIEWNNYKQRAYRVLDNSEKALDDWKKLTGIGDTTNGTRKKE